MLSLYYSVNINNIKSDNDNMYNEKNASYIKTDDNKIINEFTKHIILF